MEKLHYGRVVAAGWLFVLVVAATLWDSDSQEWRNLGALLSSGKPTTLLAIITAIAGLGGPPAVGLLLDRLAALAFLAARRSMWNLPFNEAFGNMLASREIELEGPISSSGAFQAFFYTYADSRLIDWMRRRTTYAYGSLTSAMAIVAGLIVSLFVFRAFSLAVCSISLCLVIALLIYTRIVTNGLGETGQAWVSTIGRIALKQYSEALGVAPKVREVGEKNAKRR